MNHHDQYFFSMDPEHYLKLRWITKDKSKGLLFEWIDYTRLNSIDSNRITEYTIEKRQLVAPRIATNEHLVCEVDKTRKLYIILKVRIHLDCVKDLGEFIEIEVDLSDDSDTEEIGVYMLTELKKHFGILEDDLITCSYLDLMLKKKPNDSVKKVYVASAFHNKEDVRTLISTIKERQGADVTHNWTDVDEKIFDTELIKKIYCAEWDVDGVKDADVLVALMDDETYEFRGTFCEIGVALGAHKRIFILCSKKKIKAMECVFYYHPLIMHVNSIDELIHALCVLGKFK